MGVLNDYPDWLKTKIDLAVKDKKMNEYHLICLNAMLKSGNLEKILDEPKNRVVNKESIEHLEKIFSPAISKECVDFIADEAMEVALARSEMKIFGDVQDQQYHTMLKDKVYEGGIKELEKPEVWEKLKIKNEGLTQKLAQLKMKDIMLYIHNRIIENTKSQEENFDEKIKAELKQEFRLEDDIINSVIFFEQYSIEKGYSEWQSERCATNKDEKKATKKEAKKETDDESDRAELEARKEMVLKELASVRRRSLLLPRNYYKLEEYLHDPTLLDWMKEKLRYCNEVEFGQYYDKPIIWIVIKKEEELQEHKSRIRLLSKKILDYKRRSEMTERSGNLFIWLKEYLLQRLFKSSELDIVTGIDIPSFSEIPTTLIKADTQRNIKNKRDSLLRLGDEGSYWVVAEGRIYGISRFGNVNKDYRWTDGYELGVRPVIDIKL